MDFKSYLLKNARDLDQEIDLILSDFLKEVKKLNPKLIPFAIALMNVCKGGKRIRGVLVKLGYEIGNQSSAVSSPRSAVEAGHQSSDIIKVGAAYEILHAALLIHDDILDQSELRRGKPTLYRALGGDHYGISQAIGLGDIGLFLPIKLIADANFLGEYKHQALSFLAQTIIYTAWGEVLDVELPHLDGERKEEDVIAIHTLKTAQYTISGPLIVGAILGGGDQNLLRELGQFGEALGIAFQIQDDILGVFGDEQELGKSVVSDIEEGKNTLLITEAFKRANPMQKQILGRFYGHGQVGNKGLEEVRKVFLETGALDYSRQEEVKYVLAAKSVIPKITKDPKIVKLLTEMADFLIERHA